MSVFGLRKMGSKLWQNCSSLAALAVLLTSLSVQCQQVSESDTNSRPVLKLKSVGATSGAQFDDFLNATNNIFNVRSILIGSGNLVVFYMQVNYTLTNGSLYAAPCHGTAPGNSGIAIKLAPDEYLRRLEGVTDGNYVNKLYNITTYTPKNQSEKHYGPFGSEVNATQKFVFEGFIVGFYGAVGKFILSNLGVYALAPVNKTTLFGNSSLPGAKPFVDDPDAIFPPAVKIDKLYMRHWFEVKSIQAEYRLYGGGTRKGPRNGVSGGILSVLDFEPDEHIVGIQGKIVNQSIQSLGQLTFITNNKGNVKTYGPFGTRGSKAFRMYTSVIGFAGTVYKIPSSLLSCTASGSIS